ncbi:peptidylprolyl isomerase [Glaciecola sp. SC05]|uniref:peptidylprolyl isomerase n=1 Tax=Glaciecola sp. SC05 TaxID=1987355 RepID=UPI003528310F
MNTKTYTVALLLSLASIFSASSQATVVEVRTIMGDFQVNLFDEATPQTVANFLEYVNSRAYANNTVHRSSSNFVIQMGGFQYNNAFPPELINVLSPVRNEPVLSNLRGTLAMAKQANNPNSATSQFFVNLGNNSSNLDLQNGGFTVFGQVLGDGMDVVDAIAALSIFSFSFSNDQPSFPEIPLRDYTTADQQNGVIPDESNLVIITDIVVIDPAVVTNPNLNPAPNTLINAPSAPPSSSGGGGSLNVFLLLGLAAIASFRRRYRLAPAKP